MTEDALSKHAKAVAKTVVPHVAPVEVVAAPSPVAPAATQTPAESSEEKN